MIIALAIYTLISVRNTVCLGGTYLSTEYVYGDTSISYKQLFTTIIKSKSDRSQYRALELDNKIEVLLISDPDTHTSAASLRVGVGLDHDPKDLPGLAHLCEHALYMGTSEYKAETEFEDFSVGKYGDFDAFTSFSDTNFYFKIDSTHLDEALERFHRIFENPLLRNDSLYRAIDTVDKEFMKFQNDDDYRSEQILRSYVNHKHPFATYFKGNSASLLKSSQSNNTYIHAKVNEFFEMNYSPEVMKLVVYGKESLDELTNMVVPKFQQIPKRHFPKNVEKVNIIRKGGFSKLIKYETLNPKEGMEIMFLIPGQLGNYLTKPAELVCNMLSDQGTGSVQYYLKESDLIYSLSAHILEDYEDFALLGILIDLTSDGLDKYETVVNAVLQYIKLINNPKFWAERFGENLIFNAVNFEFKNKPEPVDYVSALSKQMFKPILVEEYVTSGETFKLYDKEKIEEIFEHLVPNEMSLVLKSPRFSSETNKLTERWFGGEYTVEELLVKKFQILDHASDVYNLSLPKPNPFIPANFELVPCVDCSYVPKKLISSKKATLWFSQGKFLLPRGMVRMRISNPDSSAAPYLFAQLEMLVEAIKDQLGEEIIMAETAGLGFEIMAEYNSIMVDIEGISDQIPRLIARIGDKLRVKNISEKKYKYIRNKILNELSEYQYKPPLEQAYELISYSLDEKTWTSQKKLESLETSASKDDSTNLALMSNLFFRNVHSDILVVGNFVANDVEAMIKPLLKNIHLQLSNSQEFTNNRNTLLPYPKCSLVYKEQLTEDMQKNSATVFYLDIYSHSADDFALRIHTEILASLMEPEVTNYFQTVEVLAYSVYVREKQLTSRGGLEFQIESDFEPDYIEKRIDDFIENFKKKLSEMSEEKFVANFKGLSRNVKGTNPEHDMPGVFERLWGGIKGGHDRLDLQKQFEKRREVLNATTLDNIISLINKYCLNSSENRRKFSVQMISQDAIPGPDPIEPVPEEKVLYKPGAKPYVEIGSTTYDVIISDLDAWKSNQDLSALVPPSYK